MSVLPSANGTAGDGAAVRAAFHGGGNLRIGLVIDGRKLHELSGAQQNRLLPVRVVQLHGRAADQLPAARRVQRVSAGLRARDAHAARRDPGTRLLQPGRCDALVHAAQVGKAGGEAQHVHQVFGGAVNLNHLGRTQAAVPGHEGQIRPHVSAVAHGQLDHLRRSGVLCGQIVQKRVQARGQLAVQHDLRAIVHRHGPVGGHDFHHAGQRGAGQRAGKGPDLRVDGGTDFVGEFHVQRQVAHRANSGGGHGLSSGCASRFLRLRA